MKRLLIGLLVCGSLSALAKPNKIKLEFACRSSFFHHERHALYIGTPKLIGGKEFILNLKNFTECKEYGSIITAKLNSLSDKELKESNFGCKRDINGIDRVFRYENYSLSARSSHFFTPKDDSKAWDICNEASITLRALSSRLGRLKLKQ